MKKILVTGFDPFGGEKVNPALEVIKLLPKKIGENEVVDGKNVFGVMTLGAAKGEQLKLRAVSENGENSDEESKLLDELRQLIEIDKFFEK